MSCITYLTSTAIALFTFENARSIRTMLSPHPPPPGDNKAKSGHVHIWENKVWSTTNREHCAVTIKSRNDFLQITVSVLSCMFVYYLCGSIWGNQVPRSGNSRSWVAWIHQVSTLRSWPPLVGVRGGDGQEPPPKGISWLPCLILGMRASTLWSNWSPLHGLDPPVVLKKWVTRKLVIRKFKSILWFVHSGSVISVCY